MKDPMDQSRSRLFLLVKEKSWEEGEKQKQRGEGKTEKTQKPEKEKKKSSARRKCRQEDALIAATATDPKESVCCLWVRCQ